MRSSGTIKAALSLFVAVFIACRAEGPRRLEKCEFAAVLGRGTAIRDSAFCPDGSIVLVGGLSEPLLLPNGEKATPVGRTDILVLKLSKNYEYLWARVIGGPGTDRAYAVEVGPDGDIYCAGRADAGLATTKGVVQENFGGDLEPTKAYGPQDGFVAKFDANGGLVFLTYFGGDGREFIRDLDVAADGRIAVAVTEGRRPFPYIGDGRRPTRGGADGIVAVLSKDGDRVLWAEQVGGQGDDLVGGSVRFDRDGNVYALGTTESKDLECGDVVQKKFGGGSSDAHLLKFGPGGALLFQTYLGGPETDGTETHQLAIDIDGYPIVGLTTLSKSGLVTNEKSACRGASGNGKGGSGAKTNYPGDIWIARLAKDGKSVLQSTYFGGSAGEGMEGISVLADGRIVVSGGTFSKDLPSIDPIGDRPAEDADAFVAVFSRDLSKIVRSSSFGGKKWDVARSSAVDTSGRIVAAGETLSDDFPLVGKEMRSASPRGENQSFLLVTKIP